MSINFRIPTFRPKVVPFLLLTVKTIFTLEKSRSDWLVAQRHFVEERNPRPHRQKTKNSKTDIHSVFMFAKHSARHSRNARIVNKFLGNTTFRCLANTVVHEDQMGKQINGRFSSRKALRRE